MSKTFDPEIGRAYEIRFPFKMGEHHPFPDEDGPPPAAIKVWQPGWDQEASQYGEHHWCEAWGAEIRTIVSIHKPGRYPERVFYVRQWRDPDGKVFGKKSLRILASRDFRRWASGDRYERAFRSMVCEQPDYEPGDAA